MVRDNDGLKNFNIVLYQPEIPANTGNIGRLCVGCNSSLHIIKPMRFLLTDKQMTRAGLDYWQHLDLNTYDNIEDIYEMYPKQRIFLASTKGNKLYSDIEYKQGDVFVFGPETKGLPESLLNKYPDQVVKIPMDTKIRSINLANSVAIIIYEALRQINNKQTKKGD